MDIQNMNDLNSVFFFLYVDVETAYSKTNAIKM